MSSKAVRTSCVVGSGYSAAGSSQHLSRGPRFWRMSWTSITKNPPFNKKKPCKSQICRYFVPSASMKVLMVMRSVAVAANPAFEV